MTTTRREFIQFSAAAVSAVGLAGLNTAASSTPTAGPTVKPMKLLILGGTGFIGPHMVQAALDHGHEVTIFNRGKSNPGLFPGVEELIGDRDGDLDSLKGRDWDAVIDNTGYVPRHVRDSADLLQGHVGRYLFTSTGSVYALNQERLDEDSKLLDVPEPDSEDVNKYYGELKVLCEQAVTERYGEAATIVRPHIVAGPGDKTDRYTYWPVRIDRGGEMICPGDPLNPVQYIDVRDLSGFCLHLVERNIPGIFNGAGPCYSELGMQEFIYAVRGVTSSKVEFTWIDEAFLAEHGIELFGFPLWISVNSDYRGLARVGIERSVANGLTLRPLAVTALDTLEWFKAQPADRREKLNLNLERDAAVLQAWHART
jgi:2'-hydroxyisoflavone reductase